MNESRIGGRSKKAPANAAPERTKAKLPAATKAKQAKPVATKAKAAQAKPAAPTKAKTARNLPASSLDDVAFQKVRTLVAALPDTKLTMTWGSPHFRVGEKIFCGLGVHDGRQLLSVKLEPSHARRVVKEPRFVAARYVGKHGWVSMDISRRASWDEVSALLRESYGLIAPKASLAKLR